jgi:hypothetical protein
MARPMELKATQEHIKHFGLQMQAEGNEAVKAGDMAHAKRCADLYECARDEGLILIGEAESRSPTWMDEHHNIVHSAQHHKLVKYDLDEANEDGEYDD